MHIFNIMNTSVEHFI